MLTMEESIVGISKQEERKKTRVAKSDVASVMVPGLFKFEA
jgi:hypothetical protein